MNLTNNEFECDNISYCHDPITIGEDGNAIRVFCRQCNNQYLIRKDERGVVDNREYSKIFKKEILQPNSNLFYKYYDTHLRT